MRDQRMLLILAQASWGHLSLRPLCVPLFKVYD